MHVVRLKDAPAYDAPGHNSMDMLRLQGREAGPADVMWLGMSRIKPGGGIDSSASKEEKFYVVLEGELMVETPEGSVMLSRWDSCRIAPGEPRTLKNETKSDVTVLLAMPLAQANKDS
jgi:glyoxylate utilization-related uncharacterized protein